ncbi:site-specific integrase [Streptomyces sp. S4.7]|uniref:site-specific integrase n=1 Tax=Streptomyces sp. S4.7 TaxID=2705439 RepID=UPI001EF3BCF0|nr:site-specific integrase [Streptomyces sp. S4.7]
MAGTAICRDCAGISRDFFCDRCGFEGLLLGGRLCERCTLSDQLTALLDDGTGCIHPQLIPLHQLLVSLDRPKSRLIWLRNRQVPALLRDLATGTVPLTHDAIQALPNWRTAAYLRDLLMDSGVLPHLDRRLLLFERWLAQRIATTADTEHARILQHFATWHQLRKLRAKAAKGPLGTSTTQECRQQITQAGAFLVWLAARHVALSACTQTDLDAWHAEKYATRRPAQAFLRWCMETRRMPRLIIPNHPTTNPHPMGQHQRVTALQRVLADDSTALRVRVAACLVLLFAQPVSRIVRMTTDDVLRDGQCVTLRLGDPPTPAPEPVADLLLDYLQALPASTPAINQNSPWLFPGRRASQPMNPATLRDALRKLGIPVEKGRTSAIRQLVLQAPAPVIAQALGYHDKSTTRIANDAGAPWKNYAPGDHNRRSPRLR